MQLIARLSYKICPGDKNLSDLGLLTRKWAKLMDRVHTALTWTNYF